MALLPHVLSVAGKLRLDPAWLASLLEHETEGAFEPTRATRPEPGYSYLWPPGVKPAGLDPVERDWQRHSWGCGQVMGAVLRQYGWQGPIPAILDSPEQQVQYAARYLRSMLLYRREGRPAATYEVAAARYNAGYHGEDTRIGREYASGVLSGVDRWRAAIALAELDGRR
jgi:hypothetical protein